MSKKHYIAIAAILKAVRKEMVGRDSTDVLDETVKRLATVFAGDNDRFDYTTFAVAAGHSSVSR